MDIVFAKHNKSDYKEYCFEVPVEIKKQLKKDMMIFVGTRFGKQIAYTTTRVVSGAGAIDVAIKNGANTPLQRVISFVPLECEKMIEEQVKNNLVREFETALHKVAYNDDPILDPDIPF